MRTTAIVDNPVRSRVHPRWISPDPVDEAVVARLMGELSLPRVVCELLARRGFHDAAAAKSFLRPRREHIEPPWGLAGMDMAADRVAVAVRRRETILVHGDYDVDGICSTALLTRAISMMDGRVVPFVPNRLEDGYDLTEAGVSAARQAGATLIVTADCGIVAHAAVERAATFGIDVVVTDHHTPGPTLPPAYAVVDPNREDCGYPGKGLAGAGVAYKLAVAVADRVGFDGERIASLLDLVAVATIADLAPVTGENRALLRWGLTILGRTRNRGLQALLRSSGLAENEEITAGQVGYILAPRLNAAGRLGDAMRGVRLLLTEDPVEAKALAADLEAENGRRRDLDSAILADAFRMIDREYDPARDTAIVLASTDWHPGVIGIVASRIVERLHRPTVLFALGAEEGKGSGRSIRGFHLHAAFTDCADLLIRFGGHRAAAGCSIHPTNVIPFREAFNAVARQRLAEEDLVPRISLDAEISLEEATPDLCRLLRYFAPFGVGNPTPVLGARRVRVLDPPRVVGDGHLKLQLGASGASLSAIGFGMGDRKSEVERSGGYLDIAFRLEENTWRGKYDRRPRSEVQARLVDVKVVN